MASGDTLATWLSWDGVPIATNGAQFDTRNLHRIATFDTTTQETLIFEGILPRNYAGGGVTLTLIWMAATATSGATVWDTAFERMDTSTDLDADSFAAVVTSGASSAPATSGQPVYLTNAHTNGAQMDSVAVGEAFRLQVRRAPANAGDTMAGDGQLLGVEMKET